MITSLIALFPLSWPESLRKAAAWASVAIAAALLLWGAWEALKGWIIEEEDQDRAVESMGAHNQSAEQRAIDAVVDMTHDRLRNEAIEAVEASEAAKPPAERATLPPSTTAMNCVRMREAYSKADLAKMPAFKEHC